jgi:hypothetical protein
MASDLAEHPGHKNLPARVKSLQSNPRRRIGYKRCFYTVPLYTVCYIFALVASPPSLCIKNAQVTTGSILGIGRVPCRDSTRNPEAIQGPSHEAKRETRMMMAMMMAAPVLRHGSARFAFSFSPVRSCLSNRKAKAMYFLSNPDVKTRSCDLSPLARCRKSCQMTSVNYSDVLWPGCLAVYPLAKG